MSRLGRASRRGFLKAAAATAGGLAIRGAAAGAGAARAKKQPARVKTEEDSPLLLTRDDGYRGIWYFNQPQKDEYAYKYSGGLGTFCCSHQPFAVYASEVRKTVNAHPDFYAFWADGHARQPSDSRLYFCNQRGDVRMLPACLTWPPCRGMLSLSVVPGSGQVRRQDRRSQPTPHPRTP